MKALWTILLLICTNAIAQTAGTIDLVEGSATIINASGTRRAAAPGGTLVAGETIETGASAELHATLIDGAYLALRPNTSLKIATYRGNGDANDGSVMELARGALRTVTGWIGRAKPQNYRISTPTATVGIRGTDHEVAHIETGADAGTHNRVYDGRTTLNSGGRAINVERGRAALAAGRDVAPRIHARTPAFLADNRFRSDSRVVTHRAAVRSKMEASLKQRGLLKSGETVDRHLARRRAERIERVQQRVEQRAGQRADQDVAARQAQREAAQKAAQQRRAEQAQRQTEQRAQQRAKQREKHEARQKEQRQRIEEQRKQQATKHADQRKQHDTRKAEQQARKQQREERKERSERNRDQRRESR